MFINGTSTHTAAILEDPMAPLDPNPTAKRKANDSNLLPVAASKRMKKEVRF
jgi:hypothetical protein